MAETVPKACGEPGDSAGLLRRLCGEPLDSGGVIFKSCPGQEACRALSYTYDFQGVEAAGSHLDERQSGNMQDFVDYIAGPGPTGYHVWSDDQTIHGSASPWVTRFSGNSSVLFSGIAYMEAQVRGGVGPIGGEYGQTFWDSEVIAEIIYNDIVMYQYLYCQAQMSCITAISRSGDQVVGISWSNLLDIIGGGGGGDPDYFGIAWEGTAWIWYVDMDFGLYRPDFPPTFEDPGTLAVPEVGWNRYATNIPGSTGGWAYVANSQTNEQLFGGPSQQGPDHARPKSVNNRGSVAMTDPVTGSWKHIQGNKIAGEFWRWSMPAYKLWPPGVYVFQYHPAYTPVLLDDRERLFGIEVTWDEQTESEHLVRFQAAYYDIELLFDASSLFVDWGMPGRVEFDEVRPISLVPTMGSPGTEATKNDPRYDSYVRTVMSFVEPKNGLVQTIAMGELRDRSDVTAFTGFQLETPLIWLEQPKGGTYPMLDSEAGVPVVGVDSVIPPGGDFRIGPMIQLLLHAEVDHLFDGTFATSELDSAILPGTFLHLRPVPFDFNLNKSIRTLTLWPLTEPYSGRIVKILISPVVPTNDDRADAHLIEGPSGEICVPNYHTTWEAPDLYVDQEDAVTGLTVWFKWTAGGSGSALFKAFLSNPVSPAGVLESVVTVWHGDTRMARNQGVSAGALVEVEEGEEYFIQLDSADKDSAGSILFQWSSL